MELYGIACVIQIGSLQVPWNSMELLSSSKLSLSEFHGTPWNFLFFNLMKTFVSSKLQVLNLDIPWNLSFPIVITIILNFAGWINFHKLISTLYFLCLFRQLMFYPYLRYTTWIYGITNYISKYHSKYLFRPHWNLFWSKSAMELSPEFHGTFSNNI